MVSQWGKVNDLSENCSLGLGLGGNYLRCLAITVISVGLGGAKKCGGDFKVIIVRIWEGRATKRNQVLRFYTPERGFSLRITVILKLCF